MSVAAVTKRSVLLLFITLFTLTSVSQVLAATTDSWWDADWYYRVPLVINASAFNRVDWPIEHTINFTEILTTLGDSADFDYNSTRLIEYDSSGNIITEIASQFDQGTDFNVSINAHGTFVFILNGTTAVNAKRYFQLYFDTSDRPKAWPTYSNNLQGTWNGEEFNITTDPDTKELTWYIDTNRGDNLSGIYRIVDEFSNEIFTIPSATQRPIEYMTYFNGSMNFSFDLRNNGTFKYKGPARIVIEQKGNETVWNDTNLPTGNTIVKRYIFYEKSQYVVIEQEYTNNLGVSVQRNSSPATALGLDVVRAGLAWTADANNSEPGSWQWYASTLASEAIGIINLNSSGNFSCVDRNATSGRIGIELNMTDIAPGQTITEKAAIHINNPASIYGTPAGSQIRDLKDRFLSPTINDEQGPENWITVITTQTNETIYNRGENVTVTANITLDNGSLIAYINATLHTSADNFTIMLVDDGTSGDLVASDNIWTNNFTLPINATLGIWNITAHAFDSSGFYLNKTTTYFNVTDQFIINITVWNSVGLVNRTINATIDIWDIRHDQMIPNATLNCTWLTTELTEIIDYANGSYKLNYTASSYFGDFALQCLGNKTGNSGNGTAMFSTEDAVALLDLNFSTFTPGYTVSNLTLHDDVSFAAIFNASNIGNGTAYSLNVSLTLLDEWASNSTLELLSTIPLNGSSVAHFWITVPNGTAPGIYEVNATLNWTNPDNTFSTDITSLNITIDSNPVLNVSETNFSDLVPAGTSKIIANFTVFAIGNDNLTDVTFNVTGLNMTLTYSPPNITDLGPGYSITIALNVSVPLGHQEGLFSGIINVSSLTSNDDVFNITIEVPGTNMSVSVDILNVTLTNVTWFAYDNYTLQVNTTNVGRSTAADVNITLDLPDYWTTNASDNKQSCGNLAGNTSCSKVFMVAAQKAVPGNYTVNATIIWQNTGVGTNSTQTNMTVIVLSNPFLTISQESVGGTAENGKTSYLTNFSLLGSGNDNITGLVFNLTNLTNFTLTYIPQPTNLTPGQNATIRINITIPSGFPSGNYTGYLNITSAVNISDLLQINVTVPVNRTFTLSPTYCFKPTFLDEDEVCGILVNNTGNEPINFTVSPDSSNYTTPNVTSIYIPRLGFYNLSITYNLSGIPKDFYNVTFTVTANQTTTPQSLDFNISLAPYALPVINITLLPSVIPAFGTLNIYVNITDLTGGGIAYTELFVTTPLGNMTGLNMTLVGIVSNIYRYYSDYPGSWGNTSETGYYNVTVSTVDAASQVSEKNDTFYVYANLTVDLNTGYDDYYTGESGSIYYNATDASGLPLQTNTTITLRDNQNHLRYSGFFQSNTNGTLNSTPSFTVPSDAPVGNWTLSSVDTYIDPLSNVSVNASGLKRFGVFERYNAAFDTSVVWYPNSVMTFYLMLYTDHPISTPDRITLVVYDPAFAVYTSATIGDFTLINSTSNSLLYSFQYAMPAITASGFYLADLTVAQGTREIKEIKSFRVSTGGPYDVAITNITSEAEQGGDQDFTAFLWNLGDFGQDVFIDYWITDEDTTYDLVTKEAVFVGSQNNVTLKRSLSIYSDQPLGTYTLHLRLNYSSLQPVIETTRNFQVVTATSAPSGPTTGGAGGGGGSRIAGPIAPAVVAPPRLPKPGLTILNVFPDELLLERGGVAYIIIEIRNTGDTDFFRINSVFEGIPREWWELIREVGDLKPNGIGYLITRVEVPIEADPKRYPSFIRIQTPGIEESMEYNVEIFESKEELLRARIRKLKELIITLETESAAVAQGGVDINPVLILLERSTRLLGVAESYLGEGRLIETTESVDEVQNLLEEARYRLSLLSAPKTTIIEVIPFWVYVLVGLVIIITIISVLYFKGWVQAFRRSVSLRMMAEQKPVISKGESEFSDSKMLATLKKHYDDGLISAESYKELRKKYKN
ncbi:MAG: NEW3 domain-containing protein [Nanoarchaeota archaeon]